MDAESGETGGLAEGLTVLEAEVGTLALAYRQGDDVIFMEALRGQPSMYEGASNMPAFEVDARFLSDDGGIFYTRRGGDRYVDPSWAADLQRQTDADPRMDGNEHLFRMAGDVAAILHEEIEAQIGEERAAELAPEIDGVFTFAANAVRLYEESVATRLEHIEHERQAAGTPRLDGEEPGDVAYGTGGPEDAERSFGSNYYYIAVHEENIDWFGIGEHSATQLHEWKGYWAHVHDFCNHGECASGMGRDGLLQYYEALQDYKPAWTAQTCDTGYDWDSDPGGHNCHDDSRLQMNNFVFNSVVGGSQYWCSDGSTNKWTAPSATGDDDTGYNHPAYCGWDSGTASSCSSSWQGDGTCDCGCRFPDGTHADPDCA